MNRKQRREAARKEPKPAPWQKVSKREAMEQLYKNGITAKDIDDAQVKGYTQGWKAGEQDAIKSCYAAAAIALHELHGFGKQRVYDVLKRMDEILIYRLTNQELTEQAWKDTGLEIDFNEPMERVSNT